MPLNTTVSLSNFVLPFHRLITQRYQQATNSRCRASKLFMNYHLTLICICAPLVLLDPCLPIATQLIQGGQDASATDGEATDSVDTLTVSYTNDLSTRSFVVWFAIGSPFNDTFDLFRFTLRSMGHSSAHPTETLVTNFTLLTGEENRLRLFKLDSGQYDVCIDFRSNSSNFVYRPRDGCVTFRVGEGLARAAESNSLPLVVALVVAAAIFFLAGVIVTFVKKRLLIYRQPSATPDNLPPETRVRKLFHRHLDRPHLSRFHLFKHRRGSRYILPSEELEMRYLQSLVDLAGNTSDPSEPLSVVELLVGSMACRVHPLLTARPSSATPTSQPATDEHEMIEVISHG